LAVTIKGYMPSGNVGSIERYAASRMGYSSERSSRALASGMGIISVVPLRLPVTMLGYSSAMGFGLSTLTQASCADEVGIRVARRSTRAPAVHCRRLETDGILNNDKVPVVEFWEFVLVVAGVDLWSSVRVVALGERERSILNGFFYGFQVSHRHRKVNKTQPIILCKELFRC
jgi:hypothetical protein